MIRVRYNEKDGWEEVEDGLNGLFLKEPVCPFCGANLRKKFISAKRVVEQVFEVLYDTEDGIKVDLIGEETVPPVPCCTSCGEALGGSFKAIISLISEE